MSRSRRSTRFKELVGVASVAKLGKDIITSSLGHPDFNGRMVGLVSKLQEVDVPDPCGNRHEQRVVSGRRRHGVDSRITAAPHELARLRGIGTSKMEPSTAQGRLYLRHGDGQRLAGTGRWGGNTTWHEFLS